MNKSIIWGFIIILVIVGGIALFKGGSTEQTDDIDMHEDEMMVDENGNVLIDTTSGDAMMEEDKMMKDAMMTSVKEFTVSGQNFSFAPSTMTVQKGDTVRITFKNVSGFHDLVIPEFKVATKQTTGPSEETVEFVANKTGSFEYYCSVGNHRAQGMKGMLVVQ